MNIFKRFSIVVITLSIIVLFITIANKPKASTNESERLCMQVGCHNGLYIEANSKSSLLIGSYKFEFTGNDLKFFCHIEVSKGRESSYCSRPIHKGTALIVLNKVGKISVSIRNHKPKTFTLRLFFGDNLIWKMMDVNPQYEVVYPNGKECEPKCLIARIFSKVAVDFTYQPLD